MLPQYPTGTAILTVTLAKDDMLPDDGPRTETCRSVLNVLVCKFYICAVVGIIIE